MSLGWMKLKDKLESEIKKSYENFKAATNGQKVVVVSDLVKEAKKVDDKIWGTVNKLLGL